MPSNGSKLMRAQERARDLRSENNELKDALEVEATNPSTLRQFVAVGIIDSVALVGSFGYVSLQQQGWMPKMVPVDGLAGAALQLGMAFMHGPTASVFRDIGHGMTAGAAGRVGAQMAYEDGPTAADGFTPTWRKPGVFNGSVATEEEEGA